MFDSNFIERILSSKSEENRDAVITISRFLIKESLTIDNAYYFFKILNLNIQEASDEIFKHKSPENFFTALKPFKELIQFSLKNLIEYKPKELYYKNILASFGVLQNAYKNADNGFKIYALTVSDIQHIGKYLILDNEKTSSIILELLDCIWRADTNKYKETTILAKEIVDAYYDNKKRILDVIPHNLLI